MRKLIVALMALSLSIPSFADEAACRSVLHKCDTAVKALQVDNALQKAILDDQAKVIDLQKQEIDAGRAWYRKPEILIPLSLLVGFVGGVYVIRQ